MEGTNFIDESIGQSSTRAIDCFSPLWRLVRLGGNK